jgi:hypothetical protein
MTKSKRYFCAMVVFITVALMEVYAQGVTLKQAEIRPVAGLPKESVPQFSVLLSVSGVDNIKSIHIVFFSDNSPGKVSVDVTKVTEGDKHFILSLGARFPVNGDDIVFNIQVPRSYNPEMRQAYITIDSQSGVKSNTIMTTW